MVRKRESLWNAATLEKYVDRTEQSARNSVAERNGEHTAENLESIWLDLTRDEKLFIEYLYLSEKRAAIALYEEGLFSGLMSKGLLQTPPGVGTLFMQYLQTTYAIPIAVWDSLHDRPSQFFSHDDIDKGRRLKQLTRHFNDRVDVLLKAPSSMGPDPSA